ncbi:MAG: hypothetical protein ACKVQR_11780 [Aquabacterium sp.]
MSSPPPATTRHRRLGAAMDAPPLPQALDLLLLGEPVGGRVTGADVRCEGRDGPALHFQSLPALIRWLAELELRQRQGPGGIR